LLFVFFAVFAIDVKDMTQPNFFFYLNSVLKFRQIAWDDHPWGFEKSRDFRKTHIRYLHELVIILAPTSAPGTTDGKDDVRETQSKRLTARFTSESTPTLTTTETECMVFIGKEPISNKFTFDIIRQARRETRRFVS
jgi:hypothetical protein